MASSSTAHRFGLVMVAGALAFAGTPGHTEPAGITPTTSPQVSPADSIATAPAGATSPPRLVVNRIGPRPTSLVVSPAGDIAVISDQDITLINGASRRVATTLSVPWLNDLPGEGSFAVDWSPDGMSLSMEVRFDGRYLHQAQYRLADARETRLRDEQGLQALGTFYSTDRHLVGRCSEVDGRPQLSVSTRDPEQPVWSKAAPVSPCIARFSQDSRFVLVDAGGGQLQVLESATGRQVTLLGGALPGEDLGVVLARRSIVLPQVGSDRLQGVEIFGHGSLVARVSPTGFVVVDMATGQRREWLLPGKQPAKWLLPLTGDGSLLVVADDGPDRSTACVVAAPIDATPNCHAMPGLMRGATLDPQQAVLYGIVETTHALVVAVRVDQLRDPASKVTYDIVAQAGPQLLSLLWPGGTSHVVTSRPGAWTSWDLQTGKVRTLRRDGDFYFLGTLDGGVVSQDGQGGLLRFDPADASVSTLPTGISNRGNADGRGLEAFDGKSLIFSDFGVVEAWTVDGRKRWSKPPPTPNGFWLEKILVSAATQTVLACYVNYGSKSELLLALRTTDGHLRWSWTPPEHALFPDCNLAISADGLRVAARTSKALSLMDVRSGSEVVNLQVTDASLKSTTYGVALNSDGSRLAMQSDDGSVRIWDGGTGRLVGTLPGTGYARLAGMAFSPDSRVLAVGQPDEVVSLWDVEQLQLRASLITFADGSWLVVTPEGLYDSDRPGDLPGVSWVLAREPSDPLPVESFLREYYEPGLLAKVMRGAKLREVAALESLNRVTPVVSIRAITPSADGSTVTLALEVRQGTRRSRAQSGDQRSGPAKDLKVFRDGQLVGRFPVGASEIRPGADDVARVTLADVRVPSDRRGLPVEFSAYAFNGSGVKSTTARASYQVPQDLAARVPRTYLISIGVNEYENGAGSNLGFAAPDACAMQRQLGNALQAGPGQVIRVLLLSGRCTSAAPTVPGATKAQIAAVLDVLSGRAPTEGVLAAVDHADELRRANPEDTVIITFAGHGMAAGAGGFSLLPRDTRFRDDGDVDTASVVSADELGDWMRDIDAGRITLIVDACHAAASVDSNGFRPGPLDARGLGQLAYEKGMRVLAASQANEAAQENATLGHGLLTYALIVEGLGGTGSPARLTESQWLRFGEQRVPTLYEEVMRRVSVEKRGSRGATRVGASPTGRGRVVAQQPRLFDFRPTVRSDLELLSLQSSGS